MFEFLAAYLGYNLIVGIFLSVSRLAKHGSQGDVQNWILLLFFPVIGWGKNRYEDVIAKGEGTKLPRKWYILEYFLKLNKWFLLVQLILPIAVAVVFLFLSPSDFVGSGGSVGELIGGALIGLGFFAILFFVMFFVLIGIGIQYLVLIMLPRASQKSIERSIMLNKSEAENPPPPPSTQRTPLKVYPQIDD